MRARLPARPRHLRGVAVFPGEAVIGRALRKITIHSNHFKVGSGYATQVLTLLTILCGLGYDVALSAFYGQQGFYDERELYPGGPVIPVYPAGQHPYGGDSVGMHARHFGADLVISLMDQWAMSHETLQGIPYAAWMPVDTVNRRNRKCELGLHDANSLATWRETVPVAMSEHGLAVLENWQDEFNRVNPPKLGRRTPVLYMPHAIDTQVFTPAPHRGDLREEMGIDALFAVSLVAANRDKARKEFSKQMEAFAGLLDNHPDCVLMIHAEEENPHGLQLRRMAQRIGLPDGSYRFSSQYLLATGLIEQWRLAGTMTAADVASQATAAEGFGLPIAESLACGTPVIGTQHPVIAQVVGPGGWLAEAETRWATGHEAWWAAPLQASLTRLYELAYHGSGRPAIRKDGKVCCRSGRDPKVAERGYAIRKHAARRHVTDSFAVDVVRDKYLVPVLAALGAHFGMD